MLLQIPVQDLCHLLLPSEMLSISVCVQMLLHHITLSFHTLIIMMSLLNDQGM